MATWSLRDASATARAFPYTFYKPSDAEIAKVRVGETVKLVFDCASEEPGAPEAERMWVIVDEILADGSFVGRLDNTPRWIADLHPGERIEFDARHVINTEHDDPDNVVERYVRRAYVTNRILQDRQRIGYLYREAPDTDEDSGWRFLAGDEADAYMDDAQNIAFVSIGAVLNLDDSVVGLLDAPEGAAFERDAVAGGFVRVESPEGGPAG